jgi:hypothetical protein
LSNKNRQGFLPLFFKKKLKTAGFKEKLQAGAADT